MPEVYIGPPNPKVGRPCLHKSARVLAYIESCPEYFTFKIATIKWINHRIGSETVALSDVTMGSIMLLVMFEVSRLDPELSSQLT